LLLVFFIHALGHLTHEQSHTNHDNERILEINEGIKWRLLFEVLESAGGLQLKRVLKSEVFAFEHTKEISFDVFARSKFFLEDFDHHWLKVIV
jgi:hypothetical protein